MDWNLYATEKLAAARLAELRTARTRAALAASARRERRGLAPVVGAALIRVGQRLVQGGAVAPAKAGVRASP